MQLSSQANQWQNHNSLTLVTLWLLIFFIMRNKLWFLGHTTFQKRNIKNESIQRISLPMTKYNIWLKWQDYKWALEFMKGKMMSHGIPCPWRRIYSSGRSANTIILQSNCLVSHTVGCQSTRSKHESKVDCICEPSNTLWRQSSLVFNDTIEPFRLWFQWRHTAYF